MGQLHCGEVAFLYIFRKVRDQGTIKGNQTPASLQGAKIRQTFLQGQVLHA